MVEVVPFIHVVTPLLMFWPWASTHPNLYIITIMYTCHIRMFVHKYLHTQYSREMDVHPSSQETPVQHVYHIPALSQAVARIPTPRQLQWPKQFQWCHLPWRCWAELGIALGLLGRSRPLASTTSEARHAAGNSKGKEPSVRVSTWSNQGFWMTMSNHLCASNCQHCMPSMKSKP